MEDWVCAEILHQCLEFLDALCKILDCLAFGIRKAAVLEFAARLVTRSHDLPRNADHRGIIGH